VTLNPQTDLYGRILFHQGRFCRLRGYQWLTAKECVAEILAADAAAWFGLYLPAEFVLGNPAARDAALHAIQACIPHLRILPTGIERMEIFCEETGPHFVRALERAREGNNFIYDVEITDAQGEVIELWGGLRLRAMEVLPAPDVWPAALLAPYWERRLEELAGHLPVRLALKCGANQNRPGDTDAVISLALGQPAQISRRPDGKPAAASGEFISAAHASHFTLAAASVNEVACDLAEITARTEAGWRELLGAETFQLVERLVRAGHESADAAATRLWAATECLKKIGQPITAALTLEVQTADGWLVLRSGATTIATCAVQVRENKRPLVMAVALKPGKTRPAMRANSSALAPARL
jgi:enediyne polyketide synthase